MANSNETKLAIRKEIDLYTKKLNQLKVKRDDLRAKYEVLKAHGLELVAAIQKLTDDLNV